MTDDTEHLADEVIRELALLRIYLDEAQVREDDSPVTTALEDDFQRKVKELLDGKSEIWREEFYRRLKLHIKSIQEKGEEIQQRVKQAREKQEHEIEHFLRYLSVCSDVHLGTCHAKKEEFYEWLRKRRSDEIVVLLGD